ncbi:hypothetical protein ACIGNX_27385 [Actinosynnema sp. NPDC053489]|uniref:hypothetical protein n=1 Tax=Actinosynnema sp. NPDC053489 TaxID=3363916 RepID=UPI0037C61DE4
MLNSTEFLVLPDGTRVEIDDVHVVMSTRPPDLEVVARHDDDVLWRGSRPHRSPTRTPADVEWRVLAARRQTRRGPVRLAGLAGLPASTIGRVLRRRGKPPLTLWLGVGLHAGIAVLLSLPVFGLVVIGLVIVACAWRRPGCRGSGRGGVRDGGGGGRAVPAGWG